MRIVLALLFFLVPAAIIGGLLWRYTWCHVPDPAMAACKGTVSAVAIRRCVPKRIPPPTELQPPIPAIKRAFENCEERIGKEGEEAVLAFFNSTLKVIEVEHGRNSTAYASALTHIVVVLARAGKRFDLIHRYSEEAVSVAREVYGTDHRETAIVLHSHADLLILMSEEEYAPEAIPLMREATDIRRRTIGPDHEETAAGEIQLARLLFQKWLRLEDRYSQTALLEEAEALAEHAASVFRKVQDREPPEKKRAERLTGRIAFARGDYEKAVTYFEAGFTETTPFLRTLNCRSAGDACREYALALRKLGRDREAETVEEELERVR